MIADMHKNVFRNASLMASVILVFGLLILTLKPVYAEDDLLVTKYSAQDYDSAISGVEMGLEENGFRVQFVQRIDVGLAKAGYHSDKYRIVFFMPEHGVRDVLLKRADLADMFPLKVTVYRDKGRVYVFGAKSASLLDASVPADVRARFQSWDKQVNMVLNDLF